MQYCSRKTRYLTNGELHKKTAKVTENVNMETLVLKRLIQATLIKQKL